jgi:hypothetical protein
MPNGTYQMSYANAREALLRKFTNYHNNQKRTAQAGLDSPAADTITAMNVSASALFDMKNQTSGRDLFRQEMEPDIMARRAEILKETPGLSPIAAFQKALKELWDRADQAVWAEEALVSSEDIYQYASPVRFSIMLSHIYLQGIKLVLLNFCIPACDRFVVLVKLDHLNYWLCMRSATKKGVP